MMGITYRTNDRMLNPLELFISRAKHTNQEKYAGLNVSVHSIHGVFGSTDQRLRDAWARYNLR